MIQISRAVMPLRISGAVPRLIVLCAAPYSAFVSEAKMRVGKGTTNRQAKAAGRGWA